MSVLRLLSRGTRSRADIAATLGLSKPAVSALVERLISEGLVRETGLGQASTGGGRRPILLELNPKAGLIVAVYFNDGWHEVALVDLATETVSWVRREWRIEEDYRENLDALAATIQRSIREVRERSLEQRILGCGVAVTGVVDTRTGTLLYSAGMPGWRDVPIQDYLAEALGMPVYVENDARATTYAELLHPDNADLNTLACVSDIWGIGTGVVIQHEVYRGAYDVAVTFSHTTISENGPRCRCGNYGCWETLASTYAFLRELERRRPDLTGIDFRAALELFESGDRVVQDVLLNHTGYWLGVGIANMLNVFNPEKLVIQGDITRAGEPLRQKIEAVARERALPVHRMADISFSKLTDPVQIKGAATIITKRFFSEEDHRTLWNPAEPIKRDAS